MAEAYYDRALFSLRSGELEAAIEDMSAVIDLRPMDPRYYMERAQLYLMTGERGRAADDLEKVLAVTLDEDWVLPAKQLLAEVRGVLR